MPNEVFNTGKLNADSSSLAVPINLFKVKWFFLTYICKHIVLRRFKYGMF